eukprot:CAMPEP_0119472186 /NCGR_PEP_ID=MMETSP1344-20130328/4351_1 /TAXON_ID=236787 /ORGANISM="Florenciella parvula, Strain CCMP2471" /LENGTH=94 /DNA_ID=CAMNT_0007505093 /DNA_START=27 /DNA_END=311 /DNA_ORIENTATION=-
MSDELVDGDEEGDFGASVIRRDPARAMRLSHGYALLTHAHTTTDTPAVGTGGGRSRVESADAEVNDAAAGGSAQPEVVGGSAQRLARTPAAFEM